MSDRPAPHPNPVRLEVSVRSHAGRERRNNEDTALVASLGDDGPRAEGGARIELSPASFALLTVCDGMGGAAGGEVASRRAADAIRAVMLANGPPETRDALARRLAGSLGEASRTVLALAGERPELCGMGTTATACVIAGGQLLVAQVGDSRAYVLRAGRLTQITRDQTLATLLVERGQLTPEEARTYSIGHIILQAIGTSLAVEVDLGVVDLCRGDVILLCSDGLYGTVEDEPIREVLASGPDCDAAAEALIALANANGGPDNITVIVARVAGGDLPPPTSEVAPRKLALEVLAEEPAPPAEPPAAEEEAPAEIEPPAEPAPRAGDPAPSALERIRGLLGLRAGRAR